MRLWPLILLVLLTVMLSACEGSTQSQEAPREAQRPQDRREPQEPQETQGPEAAPNERGPLALARVAAGFDSPTHLATNAFDDALYVVEQPGRVVRVDSAEPSQRSVFLDLRSEVTAGGEQGLLSLAFHPDYADTGLFYVNYTDRRGDTRVVEYRDGERPTRVRELLHVPQPYANHNGGQLAFGPDGLLYVGMGDGGSGGDPENRAQDLSSRLGKLLRLDVAKQDADWEMVGYGLRNPWRFSFDRETGDLWLGDVGQGSYEEVDRRRLGDLDRLANYGWDVYEGTHLFEDKPLNDAGELVEPVAEYSHDQGCSVTGGFVHRGSLAEAQGRYLYGDYCSGTVWSLDAKSGQVRRESFTVPRLSSFGEGQDGTTYLVSQEGVVYRLTAKDG